MVLFQIVLFYKVNERFFLPVSPMNSVCTPKCNCFLLWILRHGLQFLDIIFAFIFPVQVPEP